MSIRKNRQMIYVGPALRKLLEQQPKRTLTATVNLLAERYAGMIERAEDTRPYCMWAGFYRDVLREVGHPLSSKEIASFPSMLKDWVRRNPQYDAVGNTAVTMLENTSYNDLVKLVDEMERGL
jgi:hypothetical protein